MQVNGINVPNHGSDEAIEQGCICPTLDSARGKGAIGTYDLPGEEKVFWLEYSCPLHGGCEDLKKVILENHE